VLAFLAVGRLPIPSCSWLVPFHDDAC